jgi:hypothetical protein
VWECALTLATLDERDADTADSGAMPGADVKFMRRAERRRAALPALAVACVLLMIFVFPNAAMAHGPVAPVATSYLGKVTRAPRGVDAKVANGYLSLWLRVPPNQTVLVLDYRGAPYVRFSRGGIYANENSEMYYLNSSPPQTPPRGLTRSTPVKWRHLSDGHEYAWHDGRIGALASTVIAPGASYVGTWSIAALVNERLTTVSGSLWHAPNPSIVWFWPIAVLIACVLPAWRLRQPGLHAGLARWLAITLLIAIGVGAAGRWLYGRPTVAVEGVIVAGGVLAFVAWNLARLFLRRAGYILDWVTALVALWIGLELLPTLVHGFVLTAVPAFVARAAAVLCLGGSVGLPLLAARKLQDAADDSAALSRDRGDEPVGRSSEAREPGPSVTAASASRGSTRGPGTRSDPRWPR